jgi:hypothetical protein
MLVMEMSAYFLAAREVVNREDPVELLGMGGAPDDEYDPEVEDLVQWRTAVTADQVGAVFRRWFGESGVMPSDMAARIADGINQARRQHLPD